MKAAYFYGPGDVKIESVPEPTAGPGELVIKVESALTCGTDVKTYRRGHPSYKPPVAFGHEAAGSVVEVGEGVTGFSVGDRVTTHNTAPCNECYWCKRGQHSLCVSYVRHRGAFAQYLRLPAPLVRQNVFHLPDDISFAAGALVEPFSCAVHGVEQADIQMADTVVVSGAGPLGLMLIRLASLRGAYVIATDLSDGRLEVARQVGAAATVNVAGLDPVKAIRDMTPDGRGVDIAIEAVGLPETWEKSVQMVRKGGTVVLFGGCKPGTTMTLDTGLIHYSQISIKGVLHTTPRMVREAFDLICRRVITPEVFVTGTYSLDNLVDALEAHARGQGIKNEIVCW